MTTHFAEGGPAAEIGAARQAALLDQLLAALRARRPLRRVLLLPPDFTRLYSGSGPITVHLYERLKADGAEVAVMPATGTHFPISDAQRESMFPGIPKSAFLDHDWRKRIRTLGEVPADVVSGLSEGRVNLPAQVQVSQYLVDEPWDAVLSVGQLVPHEVIGIANHVKNVLVGAGGADLIHKSHWVGAVYGMERVMGRAESPVRAMLDWAAERFLQNVPVTYVLTVRARNAAGELVTRGLYAGEGTDCFHRGAELCRAVNLDRLPRAPKTVVCHMDPDEFHSTWVGNKAVYRTRMAIADGGELVILAPGVKQFGEDAEIDRLIRRYGYRTTPEILAAVDANPELQQNLSAAAHLIHGSPENRFRVTYCPGKLTRAEVEGVGFGYRELGDALREYDPAKLTAGWNDVGGREVYYVPHPALGLWGTAERFGG